MMDTTTIENRLIEIEPFANQVRCQNYFEVEADYVERFMTFAAEDVPFLIQTVRELALERDRLMLLQSTHDEGSMIGHTLNNRRDFSSGLDNWTCPHCGTVNTDKSINCKKCRK